MASLPYFAFPAAAALANAFECEVGGLPRSLVLSWYEQSAVCILLILPYLGIKDPQAVRIDNFNIAPAALVEKDLKPWRGA